MVITIKDSNFIDVSKIESLLSKNEAKEIKLKSFITGSMKRRLFIVEEDERSIPYRLCPFEIYNENNISYLRILSTFYTNKVINAILEFEQNKQNIKIFKAQMDQSIAKYITSKVFLPGKNHFIDSIRDKGFYVDCAACTDEYFEIDNFNNIELKVNYECFAEVNLELESYVQKIKIFKLKWRFLNQGF